MRPLVPIAVTLLLGTAPGLTAPVVAAGRVVPGPKLPARPNIVWLVAEDLGPRLSAYGDRTVNTPNLDRLAAEGVTYTRAFSVVGVCAPSRASIITGKYPTRIGAQNMRTSQVGLVTPPYEAVPPPDVKVFTEALRAAGYYTTNNAKEDYQFKRPLTAWDESGKQAHWKNRPAGRPFFAVFNFEQTHESQVWAQADEPLHVDPRKVPLPPYYPDTPTVRKDLARHYDNLFHLDLLLGEKLKELLDAKLLDETIVFFYADHGDGLIRAKREVYDSGLHVPLIVRFPGAQNAGTRNDELVTLMDLGPTVMSLAGAKVPAWMDGQAFLGPQKATPREHFLAFRDRMDTEFDLSRAIRDRRWKYIRHFQPQRPMLQNVAFRKSQPMVRELYALHAAGKLNAVQDAMFQPSKPAEELYDTAADPHEIHNLAAVPAQRQELQRLRGVLAEELAVQTDWGFLPEPDMVRRFWPDLKQPVTAKPVFERYQGLLRLHSPTDGASVAYQTGAAIGGEHWEFYARPLALPKGTRVRAAAIRIGYAQSEAVLGEMP